MVSPVFARALVAGRTLFEQRAYFAAHDAWEAGWTQARGDERRVLQTLVLWAAAMHKHEQGKNVGASRLLERAMERLGDVPDSFDGLEVDGLREALLTSLEQVRHSSAGQPTFPNEQGSQPADAVDFVELEHQLRCPYCAEPVLLVVAPEEVNGARYVEDCPVCCRPWQVEISHGRVNLDRDDAQE